VTSPFVDPPTERLPRVPAEPRIDHRYAYGPPAGFPQYPSYVPVPPPRRTRSILLGVGLAVLGFLALIGVASVIVVVSFLPESTTDTTAAPIASAPVRSAPTGSSSTLSTSEQIFIQALDSQNILVDASDESRVRVGRLVCATFDEGAGLYSTIETLQTAGRGLSDFDAGFVVGVSVSAFCPEHNDRLQG
jgi:hypothetical protein